MADEEEPKKKSGLITILIFVVAGFILVAVGLGVGYLIFGGSQNTPKSIENRFLMIGQSQWKPFRKIRQGFFL